MTHTTSIAGPAHPADRRGTLGVDPLGYLVELPFCRTLHPMGYPVEISSNSAEVIAEATKLWDRYPVLSDAEPVRIRVIANSAQSGFPPQPFPPRGQGNLFSIVHGPEDYAVADLRSGFAFAILSNDVIADHSYFRYYFLEPLVYVMQAARHFVFVHASCVSHNGRAIVLCGNSGAGKTCLAYACARRGWEFLSGDAVHIAREKQDRTVIGRPYEIRFRESAKNLFPELRFRQAEVRSNRKVDLEIDTGLLDIPVALRSLAHHIVFIERLGPPRLERCTVEDAMRKLEETICFGDDQIRSAQRQTLSNFVGLPIWRLYYSDFDEAERSLRSLLDGGWPC